MINGENIAVLVEKLCDHLYSTTEIVTDDNLSLHSGLPGLSLTFYHAGRILNNVAFTDKSLSLFEHCLNNIDNTHNNSYGRGSCGILTLYQYYINKGIFDSDPMLDSIDEFYLNRVIPVLYTSSNYDLFNGLIGFALYYLQRNKLRYLVFIAHKLKKISENTHIGTTWRYIHPFDNTVNYNMGLAHGHPSVVMALIKIYNLIKSYDKESEAILKIISSSAQFLFSIIDDRSWASYPTHISLDLSNILRTDTESRLAWCYGDLGVAYTLYRAAQLLRNDVWLNKSLNIIEKTTQRLFSQTGVRDASFCHGVSGIIHFYNIFYRETNYDIYKTAMNFWINVLLENFERNGLESLDYYTPDGRIPHLGLLEGYSGVLSVLLSLKDGDDFNEWGSFFLL
jgi:tetratricopeptide (TPR) repeat protein